MIIVTGGNSGCRHFYVFRAVAHGNSHSGSLDHGEIVLSVAGSHRKVRVNAQKLTELKNSGAFSGCGGEEFQILRI